MRLTEKKKEKLAAAALEVRKRAYVPYSWHAVGAALLAKDGKIYTGCNIENGAYSPSLCAERTAFAKAVSEGELEFEAIAIAGGFQEQPEDYCAPCGVCRQVMAEFCDEKFRVILVKTPEDRKEYTLGQILPLAFRIKDAAGGASGKETR